MAAAKRASGGYSGDGIREVRPGVWELRISLGADPYRITKDGAVAYRRKSVQFSGTRTQARAERQRLIDALSGPPTLRSYTFRKMYDQWIDVTAGMSREDRSNIVDDVIARIIPNYTSREVFDRWIDVAAEWDVTDRLRLVEEVTARLIPDVDYTFGVLFERWLDAADLQATTVRAHRMLYNRHIKPAFGDARLRALETEQLEAFYKTLTTPKDEGGAGLHPRSVRRVHAIMDTALKRAMAWKWLDRNPAEFAKPPRVHGRPDTYTPTLVELQRALEVAFEVGPWALALVWTAAATGMRRGELCGLQWADIDGAAQAIHVRRAIVDVGGKATEKLPKTGKGRVVEIPAELVAVLLAYQATTNFDSTSSSLAGTGPWLWSTSGQRVHPDKLTDTWNLVKEKADIPKQCRLHDLRHAYGTVLAEHGGERIIAAVADQLGHSDMTTTMRNYLASVATGRRRAADLMGQLLAGTQTP